MIEEKTKVNIEMTDTEMEALHFRGRINSKMRDVVQELRFSKELIDAALVYLQSEDLDSAESSIYKAETSAATARRAVHGLQDFIQDKKDKAIAVWRKSIDYAHGFCHEHEEAFQDIQKNGEYVCETCLEAKLQYPSEGLEVEYV